MVAANLPKLPAGRAPIPAAVAAKAVAARDSCLSFQPVLVAAQAHVKIVLAQSDSEYVGLDLHGLILLYYGNIIAHGLNTIKLVVFNFRT